MVCLVHRIKPCKGWNDRRVLPILIYWREKTQIGGWKAEEQNTSAFKAPE